MKKNNNQKDLIVSEKHLNSNDYPSFKDKSNSSQGESNNQPEKKNRFVSKFFEEKPFQTKENSSPNFISKGKELS
jgi:hypothetical protein